jgi:glycine/D-amino acid oxidase-like deaminating enzyme
VRIYVATVTRDLRSGEPVWEDTVFQTQHLSGDLKVDVLVIGGGVTGSMIAEALSKRFTVAVVDRRGVAKGSTAISTGLLLYEIDSPLIRLRKKIGRERADRAWIRSNKAMHALVEKIRQREIDCDLVPRDSVYLPGDTLDAEGLKMEVDARMQCGLPSRWIDGAELKDRFGIASDGAIVSGNSAEADPVRFALGFLRCAVSRGARCYSGVDVTSLDRVRDGIVATTLSGPQITARYVVFATGYEVPKYIRLHGHEIVSTWAIATVRQQSRPWPGNALIWEASASYCYARTTRDGRVLVGGGDEDFDDEEKRKKLTPAKARKLKAWLQQLFPHLDTSVEFAWSGAFGKSSTGLPSIGTVPGLLNCFAVLGFGGNGMTYAMIGAQLIERLIIGETDPDQDLFAFPAEDRK